MIEDLSAPRLKLIDNTLDLKVPVAVDTGSLLELGEYLAEIGLSTSYDLLNNFDGADILLESGGTNFGKVWKSV